MQLVIPIKHSSSQDWYVLFTVESELFRVSFICTAYDSPRRRPRRTCDENSKCMERLNAYG